jgi:hypothetical protein
MAKLSLDLDNRVISRAEEYARQQGVSISKLVESYLAAVAQPPSSEKRATPILQSIRGILKKADTKGYRKHLSTKYR